MPGHDSLSRQVSGDYVDIVIKGQLKAGYVFRSEDNKDGGRAGVLMGH